MDDEKIAADSTTNNTEAQPKPAEGDSKIEVLLKNVGNAKVLKKTKWFMKPTDQLSYCVSFLRKNLKLEPSESIFIYVNQTFAPALDQTIQNLYDCYESDKKLVLYYATIQAWG